MKNLQIMHHFSQLIHININGNLYRIVKVNGWKTMHWTWLCWVLSWSHNFFKILYVFQLVLHSLISSFRSSRQTRIFIAFLPNECRLSLSYFRPWLKALFDATVDIGTFKISLANLESPGYCVSLLLHQSNVLIHRLRSSGAFRR